MYAKIPLFQDGFTIRLAGQLLLYPSHSIKDSVDPGTPQTGSNTRSLCCLEGMIHLEQSSSGVPASRLPILFEQGNSLLKDNITTEYPRWASRGRKRA